MKNNRTNLLQIGKHCVTNHFLYFRIWNIYKESCIVLLFVKFNPTYTNHIKHDKKHWHYCKTYRHNTRTSWILLRAISTFTARSHFSTFIISLVNLKRHFNTMIMDFDNYYYYIILKSKSTVLNIVKKHVCCVISHKVAHRRIFLWVASFCETILICDVHCFCFKSPFTVVILLT